MASFTVEGLPELENEFYMLATVPADVIWAMLDAEADIVVEAQRASAQKLLDGKYSKGAVKRAIKKGKIKFSKGVYTQYITYPGKQHGNRIAEIAFVNEFGAPNRGIKARQWIRKANEASIDKAVDAAANILFNHIDTSR